MKSPFKLDEPPNTELEITTKDIDQEDLVFEGKYVKSVTNGVLNNPNSKSA
jgi:hypothetical protein